MHVDAFTWRGGNRHSDRIAAAKDLAQVLVELADDNVVIVAHSHGGNVARSASALAGEASNRRTIVTLGTPFVTCDDRRNPELAELATAAWALGVTTLNLVRAKRDKTHHPGVGVPGWIVPPARWLLAISAAWVAMAATMQLLARGLRRQPITELIELVDPREVFAEIVIFATPADEASLALGAAELIGFATSRTTDALATVITIPVFAGLIAAEGWQVARAIRHRRNIRRVYESSFLSRIVPETAVGLAFVPALLLDWIDRLCSGWDGAGLSGRQMPKSDRLVRVSLTPVPAGHHAMNMIRQTSTTDRRSLAHALLTSDDNIVREVTATIGALFRCARPNP